jgi:hypothetical protein
MLRESRFGKVQTAALVVIALVMGAILISPAVAHVTKKLNHLTKHLDPKYYNVGEKVGDADTLDGQDSTSFLGANAKAADANLLDGQDSSAFLGANAKAADADLLDGQNSTAFLGATAKAADSDLLDGLNSTAFLGANAKAADADLLDGQNSTAFLGANATAADSDLLDGLNSTAFLGANATAADANLLDGQDSTAFLGANAKAADANLLDGQDSTSFMTGPGRLVEAAVALNPSSGTPAIIVEPNWFRVGYFCPANLASTNGSIQFENLSAGTLNVFIDDGGPNPTYQAVAGFASGATATTPGGEFVIYQVHSPTHGIATIHVMSVHRASDCHVQAQAVISN